MKKYIILRDGMLKDFELIECATLEDAKNAARREYNNYGHNMAIVVEYVPLYAVMKGGTETTDFANQTTPI